MANWDETTDINSLREQSRTVNTALSEHRKTIENFLSKKRASVKAAVDEGGPNSLRYLFTIFH